MNKQWNWKCEFNFEPSWYTLNFLPLEYIIKTKQSKIEPSAYVVTAVLGWPARREENILSISSWDAQKLIWNIINIFLK